MILVALLTAVRVTVAQDVMDAKSATFLRDRYLADMDTVHRKMTPPWSK